MFLIVLYMKLFHMHCLEGLFLYHGTLGSHRRNSMRRKIRTVAIQWSQVYTRETYLQLMHLLFVHLGELSLLRVKLLPENLLLKLVMLL